jgi:hypothetical protein
MKSLPILMAALSLLGGCASSNYATFVTKTSLAVLDVDTAPAEASIAFGRTEGYIGPRFDDGSVYPVTGFINASGAALSRQTQQVFAGGGASVLVLGQDSVGKDPGGKGSAKCADGRDRPPLFLATGTTVGLRVGFAEGSVLPTAFNFGYRRKEATLVPVAKGCQPSVLAALDSDGGARTEAGQPKASLGIVQYFATGEAADVLAKSEEVRALFSRGREAAATAVQAFAERERVQLHSTVDVLKCAAGVPDLRFDDVVVNARELGLVPEGGADLVMAANAGPQRRQRYAEHLRLLNGSEDARTVALEIHRRRVCALASAG